MLLSIILYEYPVIIMSINLNTNVLFTVFSIYYINLSTDYCFLSIYLKSEHSLCRYLNKTSRYIANPSMNLVGSLVMNLFYLYAL